MKQLIKDVLKDLSKGQVNLSSEAAREMVATTIISVIKASDRGWVLDLSTLDGKPTNKWSKTPEVSEDVVERGEDRRKGDRREQSGDDIAKALGHMDKDGEFITKGLTEKYEKEKEKAKKLIDKSVEDHERNKLSEEIVGDKGAKYIYESPDGGDTVYRRKFGEDKKELVDKKEWEKKKKPI